MTIWSPSVDYGTYLAVALTCAIIVITAVAILVAGWAIWGYRGLKNEAGRIAERAAKKTLINLVRHGDIKNMLAEEVRKRVGIEADMLFSGIQYGVGQNVEASKGIQEPPVAVDYPQGHHGGEGSGHGNE